MDELTELAHHIAYHASRSDIECFCEGERTAEGWLYDLETAESGEEQEFVTLAVRYLELRGLVVRAPERSTLVRVLDERDGNHGSQGKHRKVAVPWCSFG